MSVLSAIRNFRRALGRSAGFAIYAERNRLERFGGHLGLTDAQRRVYGPVNAENAAASEAARESPSESNFRIAGDTNQNSETPAWGCSLSERLLLRPVCV